MTQYLFTPPDVVCAPIRGSDRHFPIRRIFCVGRNYEAHAKEMGVAVDREAPFYFTKSALDYVPTGSTLAIITIGMLLVNFLALSATPVPSTTMTSGFVRTMSAI